LEELEAYLYLESVKKLGYKVYTIFSNCSKFIFFGNVYREKGKMMIDLINNPLFLAAFLIVGTVMGIMIYVFPRVRD